MRGVNDDEIADFVELTRDHAVNVRFIEYMPFDGNVWSDTKMVTYKQMMAAVQQRFPDGLQRMQVGFPLDILSGSTWQRFQCPLPSCGERAWQLSSVPFCRDFDRCMA